MGLCKKVMPVCPSEADGTTDRLKGTLIACEDEADLLNSWSAGHFIFHPGGKDRPGWTIANNDLEIMLKNA